MLSLPELERPAATIIKQRKTTLSKKSSSTQILGYAKQWRRQHVVSSLPLAKSYSTNDCSEFDEDFLTNQIKNYDNDGVQDSTANLQKRLQSGDNCTIECKALKRKGSRKARGRKNLINMLHFLSDRHCLGKTVEMNTTSKELDEEGVRGMKNLINTLHFLSDRHCQGNSVEMNTTSKELDEEGVIKEGKSDGLSGCNLVVKKRDFVDDYSMSVKCEHDDAANNMLVPYEESEPGSNSVNSEVDVGRNVQEDGRSVRSDDRGLVKYTFQRKQKRAPSSDIGKTEAGRGSTVKKQAGDTLKVRPEYKGCKPMGGDSRDSLRLAQVAHQDNFFF